MCRRLPPPSDCKSKYPTQAPAARSTRPLQPSGARESMLSSSVPIPFSTPGVCILPSSSRRGDGHDRTPVAPQNAAFPTYKAPRITLFGGAAAAWPLAVRAQQQPKMLRVGFVGMQPQDAPHYANFLKRMAELGYQQGRNFTFDYIQTPNVEGYEKNYRELAVRKVDVFLAVGNEPALRAALSVAD